MDNINLKTLARLANVSTTTVSLCLRNDKRISPKTKKRVLKMTERFKYRPSAVGRAMVSGRTKTIGLIVSNIDFYYQGLMAKGIFESLAEENYCLLLYNTKQIPEKENECMHRCVERRVEGIIIAPIQPSLSEETFQELRQKRIPFVLIDRKVDGLVADYVGTDDFKGVKKAVKYLVALGHRRIAHISGPLYFYNSKQRRAGYLEALSEAGIKPDNKFIAEAVYENAELTKKKVFGLLAQRPLPTAILCDTDIQAAAAILAVAESGLSVPRDISVVGFCDMDLAHCLNPTLTTIRQPGFEVGKEAARILLRRIKKGAAGIRKTSNLKPTEVELPTKLIIRGSTSPIAHNQIDLEKYEKLQVFAPGCHA